MFRLDKRIFWLASLYNAGLFAYGYLKPQTFWPVVALWQSLIPKTLSKESLATLPAWVTSWVFPLVMFGVLMPGMLVFTDWVIARSIDRFFLWKKLKYLFIRWGMVS